MGWVRRLAAWVRREGRGHRRPPGSCDCPACRAAEALVSLPDEVQGAVVTAAMARVADARGKNLRVMAGVTPEGVPVVVLVGRGAAAEAVRQAHRAVMEAWAEKVASN